MPRAIPYKFKRLNEGGFSFHYEKTAMTRLLTDLKLMLAVALLIAFGVANSSPPQSDSRSNPQPTQGALPDLPEAATDKRAFLRAVSLLGQSVESDVELISAMTGATIKPQLISDQHQKPPRYRTVIFFRDRDRLVFSMQYIYLPSNNEYAASASFSLAASYRCISVDDVLAALGTPTQSSPLRVPHVEPGARELVYLKDGVTTKFTFQNPRCATLLGVGVARTIGSK